MHYLRSLPIFAAVLCGAISIASGQVTTTPVTVTRTFVFPPVGLGSGETASVAVVNAAPAPSTGTGNAPSCSGVISFSNASGAIGTPTPFTVGSEQFKTVTLPFQAAGLMGIRGEIQAKVSVTLQISPPAPCSLMFSLETYDTAAGATHVVLSNSLANEVASPLPPIAPGDR